MIASLPTLPLPTETSGGFSGVGAEVNINQSDAKAKSGFGPFFSEAQTAISSHDGTEVDVLAGAESLIQQLHALPQGGKLLPLLESVLDSAVTAGIDPQQVLDQVSANLEQLETGVWLDPAAAIVAAVQQVVNEKIAARSVPRAEATVPLQAQGKELNIQRAGDEANGRTLAQQIHQLITSAEGYDKPVTDDLPGNFKNAGLDKALAQIQSLQTDSKGPVFEKQLLQQLQTPDARQTELAAMISAAFKHRAAPAPTDFSVRPDSLAAALTPVSGAQISSTSASGLPTVTVNTPFNQGNWDQAVGERIQWMVNQQMQGAQIKLNPAHLGPMEVRIEMQNDQASIQFTSAHAAVREALEAALPRLRDMFQASGVDLVDVDVSGQSFAEQDRASGDTEKQGFAPPIADERGRVDTLVETPLGAVPETGILDLFA